MEQQNCLKGQNFGDNWKSSTCMQRALPHFHITNFGQSIKNRKSREIFAYEIREMELKENRNYGFASSLSSSATSGVMSDLTLPMSLNSFSCDHNEQFSLSASAKYGESFLCSPNSSIALGMKDMYSSIGNACIFFFSRKSNISTSSGGSLDLFFMSSRCFSTSTNSNSGETGSSFGERSRSVILPACIEDSTMFASTTSNTYLISRSLFICALYIPSLTLCPISSASFSVSFDFATIDLNSLYSVIFSDMAFLAISDQFISGIESISDFKSLDIASVIVGMSSPPFNTHITFNYFQLYKDFHLECA